MEPTTHLSRGASSLWTVRITFPGTEAINVSDPRREAAVIRAALSLARHGCSDLWIERTLINAIDAQEATDASDHQ